MKTKLEIIAEVKRLKQLRAEKHLDLACQKMYSPDGNSFIIKTDPVKYQTLQLIDQTIHTLIWVLKSKK